MRARLARGIGANVYGQGITLLIQLASVPALIHAWGSDRYGVWILLSAMPMALSFADGGLILASGNAMVMAVARGDLDQAATILWQAFRFVCRAAVLVGAVSSLVVVLVPVAMLPGSDTMAAGDLRAALLILVLVVLLGVASNLTAAVFRANGDYALGVVINDTVRLAESAAVIAMAVAGGAVGDAALAWLLTRLLGQGLAALVLIRRASWIWQAVRRQGEQPIRGLFRPALASLTIPAAFAVSLQGATIAIGFALPPGAVAAFAATRTMTRAMVQASGMINHAVMPEVAMAVGRGDRRASATLRRVSLLAALATLVPAWLALVVFGRPLLALWTSHILKVDPLFLVAMATAALLHGLWLSEANLLLAVNRHGEYGWMFLITSVLTTLAVFLLARPFGLVGPAFALLVGEGAMAVWIVSLLRRDARRAIGVLQVAAR